MGHIVCPMNFNARFAERVSRLMVVCILSRLKTVPILAVLMFRKQIYWSAGVLQDSAIYLGSLSDRPSCLREAEVEKVTFKLLKRGRFKCNQTGAVVKAARTEAFRNSILGKGRKPRKKVERIRNSDGRCVCFKIKFWGWVRCPVHGFKEAS